MKNEFDPILQIESWRSAFKGSLDRWIKPRLESGVALGFYKGGSLLLSRDPERALTFLV